MGSNIIKELCEEHPEIKDFRKGFPNVGSRKDHLPYGSAVKDILDAWNFYDVDLRTMDKKGEPINLGRGDPLNHKIFPLAVKSLKHELNNDVYRYGETAGSEMHRTQIANYLKKEGYPSSINYNNVIITSSSTNAFYIILDTLFRPYDAIIMTAPNYGLFAFMPERNNISVHLLKLKREDGFKINPDELDKLIKKTNEELEKTYKDKLDYVPKVRAIFHMNPHNPLGIVLSKKDLPLLNKIGEVASKNDVFIIDDLIYRDLSYGDMAKPIGTMEKYFDNTISLFGLSKSYGLAQTRAGFVVANEAVIRMLRDKIFHTMDSASILQSSLLAGAYNDTEKRYKEYYKYFSELIGKYEFNCYLTMALVDGVKAILGTPYYKKIVKLIKKNIKDKDIIDNVLEGIPYAKCVLKPESGFFLLVDFTSIKKTKIKSEKELLEFIYRKCNTKFLVGQSFSWPYPDEIITRITYSLEPSVLIKAMTNINLAVRSL